MMKTKHSAAERLCLLCEEAQVGTGCLKWVIESIAAVAAGSEPRQGQLDCTRRCTAAVRGCIVCTKSGIQKQKERRMNGQGQQKVWTISCCFAPKVVLKQ